MKNIVVKISTEYPLILQNRRKKTEGEGGENREEKR